MLDQEAWPGSVVSPIDDSGASAPAPAPSPSAAQPQAWPGTVIDPSQLAPSAASPSAAGAGPAKLDSDGTQYQGGFADQLPVQADSHLDPADEKTLIGLLQNQKWDEAQQFVHSKGFNADNLDSIIKAYNQTGAVNPDVVYQLPNLTAADTGGTVGAVARGAGDSITLGAADKAHSIVQAFKDQLAGSQNTFMQDWNREADVTRGTEQYDQQNHPWARIAGQLLGGIALPAGLEGVGLKAGTDVLRAGGTMDEARAAASIAVRNRVTAISGAYGAGHGAISADNPGDALTGAVTEGALGALTGGIIGHAGMRLAADASPDAADTANNVVQAGESTVQNEIPDGKVNYSDLASRLQVQPTPAVTGGAPSRIVQVGLSSLPGSSAVIAKGAEQEQQGLADAATRAASSVGTPVSKQAAGEAVAQGAQNYADASRAQASDLYAARDAAFGGVAAPVRATNTENALAGLKAKYPNNPQVAELFQHAALNKLSNASPDNADNEWTLGEATDALSYVRGVLRSMDNNPNANAKVTANIRSIKNAIESDVNDAASAADQFNTAVGQPVNAVQAQKTADQFYADRAATLNGALKTPIASARNPIAVSGEKVYEDVIRNTLRKGGNLQALRDTWFRLPDDAKNTFASTAIDDMGRSTPGQQDAQHGAWSYETFLTNFDKMAPQARRIMFGSNVDSQLQDIATYAARLRRVNKLKNFSNTAHSAITAGVLGTVGLALMHGDMSAAGEALSGVAGAYGGAKLFLATAPMRQWTRTALKVATLSSADSQAAGMKSLINQLPRIAKAEPQIANQALQLQQHLSNLISSTPATVAANPALDPSGNADGSDAISQRQQNQQEFRP